MICKRVDNDRTLLVQRLPSYQPITIWRPIPGNETRRWLTGQGLRSLFGAWSIRVDDVRVHIANLIKQLAAIGRPNWRNYFTIWLIRHLRQASTIRSYFPDLIFTTAIR